MKNIKSEFRDGLTDGIPISLGYLAVSFSIGILAVSKGFSTFMTVLLSLLNLTSAGEVAGIGVIAAGGTILEIVLTQLIINARYSLMSLSLTQRLSPDFSLKHRLIAGYGVTDEIFAVASSRDHDVTPLYMYGVISVSTVGWVLGTFLGAVAGNLLPDIFKSALSVAIYGMFIAIVLPPARREKGVLIVSVMSAVCSCLIHYLPLFSFISDGFSVIICAVLSCAVISLLFPVGKDPDDEEADAK